MEVEHYMDNFEIVKDGLRRVVSEHGDEQSSAFFGEQHLKHPTPRHVERLDEQVVGLSLHENDIPSNRVRSVGSPRQSLVQSSPRLNSLPLQDCINTATKSNSHILVRTWKKLARELGNTVPNSSPMVVDRRPSIQVLDMREGKKLCIANDSSLDKENLKVVAGSQHHRAQ